MTDTLSSAPSPDDQPENHPMSNTGDTTRASWNFSLHDVRVNMAHCAQEAKDIMINCFLWCIDPAHPITRAEFASAIGYDASTVYKVFTGKYTHPTTRERLDVPSKMVIASREWLKLEKDRFIGGKNQFVLTPTSKRIFTACDLARESASPVFLIGPSHIGKTWALEHYAQENNHGRTPYVRMKAACGLGGMVKRINERVGNSGRCNTAAAIDRIKNALTPSTLLILDEMHLLLYTYRLQSFFACLEVIREIYDESGCGMVLCATHLLIQRMNEAAGDELQQLLRRGVHRVNLPSMPTKEDLVAILTHCGLNFPEKSETVEIGKITEHPRLVLRQLAKESGLKSITERLRYARKLATKAGEKLAWKHFIDAHLRIAKQSTPEADWE